MTPSATLPVSDRTPELRDLAARVVEMARKSGASEAEAFVERSREASCSVRAGEIEELSEASSKGIGLRIITDGRIGFASTTDFEPEGLATLVKRGIALARASAPDKANALPSRSDLKGDRSRVPNLFDDAVATLDPGWKLKVAFEMERAATAEDARCNNFEGSGAGESISEFALANSAGFVDSERGSSVYLWCAPVAREGESLQTASWSDHRRHFAELDSAESVGREAARRTVRMLGARKIPTCRVPVIFDPLMAAGFFASIASAASGDLVYKGASFLGKLKGKRVAAPNVTLVDDARLPGAIASAAFDGEGVPTRRLPIIEGGELKAFLYDVRTARKAAAHPTGHARRGYSSLPSIGTSNLRLLPGERTAKQIVGEVKKGLLVTSMLGRGANVITGDYSRGANGLWIEGGEIAYPVQEVTVAGDLLQMMNSIDAIGSDVMVRGAAGAPTIRFSELAIGGT